MDLNLESLKAEILQYLETSDFAVFRSHAGALEGMSIITWDVERFPDYRTFLDVARKAGQKLILFASRELEGDEIEGAVEELDEAGLERDEYREFEKRLRSSKPHIGQTCALELAFDYNSHLYVYEARPDWYEDFLDACEEITALTPALDNGEDAGRDGLSGFYSNN